MTQTTKAEHESSVLENIADNTEGDISAQDFRDAMQGLGIYSVKDMALEVESTWGIAPVYGVTRGYY